MKTIYERRQEKMFNLFEEYYLTQIDDFFDARDQFLRDYENMFLTHYETSFKVIPVDSDAKSMVHTRKVLEQITKGL